LIERYIPVILDKTRLGKSKVTEKQFRIPKSNVIINFSKRFEKKDIRNVSFNQCCGKIKVIISYENKEEEPIINNSFIGIDIGIDNLASITSNDKNFSYIVKGTPLKSMNQYYNKRRAQIQSELEKCNKKKFSRKLERLTDKRNLKIKNYLHNASRKIINLCKSQNIGNIVVGKNKGWKQEVNIGKKNNQNFVSIPFNMFIQQLEYKGKMEGINVMVTEESYTSKTDHFVNEPMKHLDERKGKRIRRGLFKSSIGKVLNADINGATGIMRKVYVISDAQLMSLRDRGDVVSPLHLEIK
jgi:putative transposase